ncbi:MAG: hypothetical protein WBD32_03180 [Acidobacteriaceae bacterium]
MRSILRALALTGILGLGAAAAQAQVRIGVGIGVGPAAVVAAIPPSPGVGYIWTPGYYYGSVWMPGRWAYRGGYVGAYGRGYDGGYYGHYDHYRADGWNRGRDFHGYGGYHRR